MQAGNDREPAAPVVDLARFGVTASERRVHLSRARAGAISIGSSNVDEAAYEGDVEDDGEERRDGMPSQAAQEEESRQRVQNSEAGYTFHGTDRGANG